MLEQCHLPKWERNCIGCSTGFIYRQNRIFHWSVVAETSRTQFIVALSNFNGKGTTAVGSNAGYSSFGVYDIAGNAREWCSNSDESKQAHYILGGGWNDPSYAFNDSYLQPAMDRSISNGFRCIKRIARRYSDGTIDETGANGFP
ncbi:MAG: SUMF1/EgtB/PvdO family nonheme iron enzyme [Chitinophagaceae bacterium]|nr:SUMF1/EgtB/PvdO family nonheme iron enzyme [Chitinophagaceae bacterium]